MKTLRYVLSLFVLASLALQSRAAVTLSFTPSIVSNTYSGALSLQIDGLTNGEMVVVQKFLDANGNGSVDTGETLVQSFKLTDGQAATYLDGAVTTVTNLNVPGDTA